MYKLVVIDDEVNILDGLVNLFPWRNIGFEVVASFLNARQALTYIENNTVNVVMTDISMPDMDGLSLAKELRRFPNIKVVLFSSFQDYEFFRSAVQIKVSDYLLKPINYEELMRCFEAIQNELNSENDDENEHPMSYYESIVNNVDVYMEHNLQDASLEKAAETVSLSPNYLSKIYKEKSGAGFYDTLIRLRMEKATELLLDPNFKTYEIAHHVGYDNPKNFSRAFRSYFNITPTEYRTGNIREKN